MEHALENPGSNPTYLEFFGLTRPPFARFSRPSEMFVTEQHSLLMAHLANATKKSDCLVVICGADGSGKTTLLNRYIASLNDDVSFVAINETCSGDKHFYLALLRQLGFSDITGTPRELQHITREFLVHRGVAGDPVLLMIDNAHLIGPIVLEQLRRICAFKVKGRRVLSVVLAGDSDVVRVMDSPAMSQTRFRSHVHFNIRVFTEQETANYVWHHLRLAGCIGGVKFPDEANALIHRYTGGIPSLINMLCNGVLTEARAAESRLITEDLVRSVADNRGLLPHVVPLQRKGRRRTDPDLKLVQAEDHITARDSKTGEPVEKPAPRPDTPDVDGKKLLDHIFLLAEQIGDLKADRMRALQDIGTRDRDINELRSKLNAQTTETEKLASALGVNSNEIGRQNQALSDSMKALQKSQEVAKKLATDLEKERSAAKVTQADIAKAKATAEELPHLKSELQAAVSNLRLADERVAEIDVLEKNTATLKEEIEEKIAELNFRDDALGDLEKLLQESESECTSLRLRVAALKTPEESVSEEAVKVPISNTDLDSSSAVTQFEQAIESIPAYQTLKEFEPAGYDGLITKFEHMIGQGYGEQQIWDALRVQQAELLEQRLPSASDEAVITYARLIVDQLGEFHLLGADLCFKMMVPQTIGGDDVSPVISERTREREFSVLDLTLRTYDAHRTIPTKEDVWPDLEPIFVRLFKAYGEDNVSALYDPLTPNIDKVLACNINTSLYSEILKLPESHAVNALRWLLSP